jgi:hypothetical protein
MNIGHKLIALGLACSFLASTSAFAKPAPHFMSEGLSHEKSTVVTHVPTARRSGYASSPDKDGWPANMILG